jgi:hypothetical protein
LNYEGLVAVTYFIMLMLILLHSAWSWKRFMFSLLPDPSSGYGGGPLNYTTEQSSLHLILHIHCFWYNLIRLLVYLKIIGIW